MKERYNTKTFRLNEDTIKNLAKIKRKKGVSYNLLFWDFIKQYNNKQKPMQIKRFDVEDGDKCPYCDIGLVTKKQSKYGEFLGCDQFPHCGFKQSIKEKLDVGMAGYKQP